MIAALPLARSYLVPAALLEFSQAHPKHGVTIIEGTYANLLAGLRNGESDVLIGALRDPPPPGDIVQEHLFDDSLAIIARANHPLTRRRPTIASLRKYQWIAPRRGSPLRAHFDAMLAYRGRSCQPHHRVQFAGGRARIPAGERRLMCCPRIRSIRNARRSLVTVPHPLAMWWPIANAASRWQPTCSGTAALESCGASARRGLAWRVRSG